MPTFGPPSHSSQRRTVRIVKKQHVSRAAMISLGIAAGAAILVFAVVRIWQSGEKVPIYERSMRDYEMDWRCEGGHFFTSTGQTNARPCWMCDRKAYPVALYKCPLHGSIEVAFQFKQDIDGVIKPVKVRVDGGEWLSAEVGLKCLHCRRDLTREQIDPLENAGQQRP